MTGHDSANTALRGAVVRKNSMRDSQRGRGLGYGMIGGC